MRMFSVPPPSSSPNFSSVASALSPFQTILKFFRFFLLQKLHILLQFYLFFQYILKFKPQHVFLVVVLVSLSAIIIISVFWVCFKLTDFLFDYGSHFPPLWHHSKKICVFGKVIYNLFYHISIDGQLCFFQFGAVANSVVMNRLVNSFCSHVKMHLSINSCQWSFLSKGMFIQMFDI